MSVVVAAPGRVNLIGEHTDYNDGFVLPVATPWRVRIEARPGSGPSRIGSGRGTAVFAAESCEPGEVEGWAVYPAGVAWALRQAGFEPFDLEGEVTSDLPVGRGVSSSAALCVGFAAVWNEIGGFGLSRLSIAEIAQRAENDFVGVRCGLMDQMASALSMPGHALLIDMRSRACRPIPWPAGVASVLCDTGTSRSLAGSAYNARRSECERACRVLGIASLRDVSSREVMEADFGGDEVAKRRARHVTTENERVLAFAQALESGDASELGRLALASHASLRDDYEVSGPALDFMVEAAMASPGCFGARMTGAGFGGACVAFVAEGNLMAFIERASLVFGGYERNAGSFVVFEPCAGFEVNGL
jgi:galactokinase